MAKFQQVWSHWARYRGGERWHAISQLAFTSRLDDGGGWIDPEFSGNLKYQIWWRGVVLVVALSATKTLGVCETSDRTPYLRYGGPTLIHPNWWFDHMYETDAFLLPRPKRWWGRWMGGWRQNKSTISVLVLHSQLTLNCWLTRTSSPRTSDRGGGALSRIRRGRK